MMRILHTSGMAEVDILGMIDWAAFVALIGVFLTSIISMISILRERSTTKDEHNRIEKKVGEESGTLSREHSDIRSDHRSLSAKQDEALKVSSQISYAIQEMKEAVDKKEHDDIHRYERLSDEQRVMDKQLDAVRYSIEELHRLQIENANLLERIEFLQLENSRLQDKVCTHIGNRRRNDRGLDR